MERQERVLGEKKEVLREKNKRKNWKNKNQRRIKRGSRRNLILEWKGQEGEEEDRLSLWRRGASLSLELQLITSSHQNNIIYQIMNKIKILCSARGSARSQHQTRFEQPQGTWRYQKECEGKVVQPSETDQFPEGVGNATLVMLLLLLWL